VNQKCQVKNALFLIGGGLGGPLRCLEVLWGERKGEKKFQFDKLSTTKFPYYFNIYRKSPNGTILATSFKNYSFCCL